MCVPQALTSAASEVRDVLQQALRGGLSGLCKSISGLSAYQWYNSWDPCGAFRCDDHDHMNPSEVIGPLWSPGDGNEPNPHRLTGNARLADVRRRRMSWQNENVLFCKVEMSYPFIAADLPFPSRCIVLHRVQPSRLPVGTVNGGLDGTRPRCWGIPVMRGMAGLFCAVSRNLT